ncbi:phosphoenolpyruvate--protein phosphotransferase [Clostridium sp. AM58-1XD]|uniref:phosphoenolpyruvate--protein phosphotransferase n=1 Tax=Clostridium sp. AM58-1XD TaxID=2292307 RepID=UPI000E466A92|nr:phosphoenolpyruvate--protein phosphotransferase [Clostridium sp. AM58-1XD]RGY98763.1 phosphoenolpyruvate--protein phosphotransferase [Clostridium sp. AM58-1XD]
MEKYFGKSVYKGIAMGRLAVFEKKDNLVKRTHIADADAEMERFEEAKTKALGQLGALYEKALKEVGEANAAIFEVHQMMMEDDDYLESIENIIRTQEVNAEYAVATTGDNFSKMFAEMDDDYMKARSIDIKDISERLINVLHGAGEGGMDFSEPVIIIADDLTPSETVQLDKEKVLAFVTVHGSANSHTAILARMMNIPALVGVEIPLDSAMNGKVGVVDGFAGEVIVEPDEVTASSASKKILEEKEKLRLLQTLKGKENITIDGKKINIYANIGNVGDVASVLANDAGGIGLFRSEFLYLGRDTYPTEEEQLQAYRQVAELMAGRKVIIRTLDIGADKKVDYFNLDEEENPALGFRAIRICLKRPEIFRTQMRALLRASVYGNIAVMYPMIISVEEIRKIKRIVEDIKEELKSQNITFGNMEQGIMIETPAAAIMSDEMAKEVDFFSIGTNDLTQYTLAIDRQNNSLDDFYDPHHPAVLRLLQMVADNAHKNGIWVGICGELGADLTLTKEFLKMGMDELSVSPSMVLRVRDESERRI